MTRLPPGSGLGSVAASPARAAGASRAPRAARRSRPGRLAATVPLARSRVPGTVAAATHRTSPRRRLRRRRLVVSHRRFAHRRADGARATACASTAWRRSPRSGSTASRSSNRATCSSAHRVDVTALLRDDERARDPLPLARRRRSRRKRPAAALEDARSSTHQKLRWVRTTLLGPHPRLVAAGRAGRVRGAPVALERATASTSTTLRSAGTSATARRAGRCDRVDCARRRLDRGRALARGRRAVHALRLDRRPRLRSAATLAIADAPLLVAAHARRAAARRLPLRASRRAATGSRCRLRPRRLPRHRRVDTRRTACQLRGQRRAGVLPRRVLDHDRHPLARARAARALRARARARCATPASTCCASAARWSTRATTSTACATSSASSCGRTSCSPTWTTRSTTGVPRRDRGRGAPAARPAAPPPLLAVYCGGSEVEQQAAMLGLPARAWSQRLLRRGACPRSARSCTPASAYFPSTPWGGALPFHVGDGHRALLRRGRVSPPARRREDARACGSRPSASASPTCPTRDDATVMAAHAAAAPSALEGARAARHRRGLGLRGRARPLPAASSSASIRSSCAARTSSATTPSRAS